MLPRACHVNATDMQCRFTPCCDVLTTRIECPWVRQLEGQFYSGSHHAPDAQCCFTPWCDVLFNQRRWALVQQCWFTPCCNLFAIPMSQVCSVDSHSAGTCLHPLEQQRLTLHLNTCGLHWNSQKTSWRRVKEPYKAFRVSLLRALKGTCTLSLTVLPSMLARKARASNGNTTWSSSQECRVKVCGEILSLAVPPWMLARKVESGSKHWMFRKEW